MTIELVAAGSEEAQSADSVQENVAALRALFPQAFAEGKIEFDTLRQLFGDAVDDGDERYGLGWSGKRASRRLALTPSAGTLRPLIVDSLEWDTTQNLMIEGDNLEVLKLLQKSYASKIKLIYIDPPYNTGNDFVYPDDYSDNIGNYLRRTGQVDSEGSKNQSNSESSGRFHTTWLNMIYPRLIVARMLLAADGAIFVSCDENEISNLRSVLDSIFGPECFVAALAVLCNPKGRSHDKYFASNHEYTLVYSRTVLPKGAFSLEKEAAQIDAEYTEEDELGKFRFIELRNTHREFGKFNRRDLYYPLYVDPEGGVSLTPTEGCAKVVPDWDDGFEGCWTWGKPKSEKDIAYLVGMEVRGRTKIYRKSYASGSDRMLKTILQDKSYITERGQREFNSLFGTKSKIFQSPKSPFLIGDYIRTSTSGDDIIMDFFAGSGTTGQAVMAQNAADGGHRRYILVQLPEPVDPANKDQKTAADFCDSIGKPRTIAELTKERLRRAAGKISVEHPGSKADLGFRAYALATSNIRAWNPGDDLAGDLEAHVSNLLPGRSEEDLIVELMLKTGLDLTLPVQTRIVAGKTAHAYGGGALIVCFADIAANDAEPLGDALANWHRDLAPETLTTMFFRDTGFAGNQAKLNLSAILEQRIGGKDKLRLRSL